MQLYWSAYSPFVRKVMIFAMEAGVADRIERISAWVGYTDLSDAVMAVNPLNQIPTLIGDDGVVYADSRVICEYLDSLHAGPPMFPPSGEARWQALRRQSLADGLMALCVLWRNERLRDAPMRSAPHLAGHERKARAALAVLEDIADKVHSTQFGIGHAAIVSALGYLDLRFADIDWRTDYPGLAPLFADLAARPSFQTTQRWLEEALG